ncbi:MAG: recombinase family protein [Bacillota bacterium]
MKVAVYCRVSTDDQADARTIENQVDFARRYCQLHGLSIYDFYLDEGVSGAVPVEGRPEGSRLIADALQGHFGAVYVYRLDRLARTALDILKTHQKLDEAGVALKSMTESFDTSTPSGKFFMTTLGGIAEIERETIAERMRVGKERALREGRWPGGPPPYGYSLENKRLVVNREESETVKLIFKLYTSGKKSTAVIADYLNALGVPPPADSGKTGPGMRGRWHGGRVWSILSKSAYCGKFLFGSKGRKRPVEIYCPPVVSLEEWEAAREARKKNLIYAGRNCRREYLLKGLVRCGICGRKYLGDGSGREGRHCYYRCAGSTSFRGGAEKCVSRSVRADILEKIVWDDVCRYILSCPQPKALVGEMRGLFTVGDPGQWEEKELAVIEKKVRSKERERKKIIGLFRRGIISEEDVRDQICDINRQMEALDLRAAEIRQKPGSSLNRGDHREWVRERLLSCSIHERRELIRDLVSQIIVDIVIHGGKNVPRVSISYVFEGFPDCALHVETRGKYRLGVPKSPYSP